MESAGVEPVALYPLTPRSSDLTPLAAMTKAGFRPKATALILNEGRADSTRAPLQEFGQIRRHSVYKSAIAQGAVEIWMPRLYAAKAIEDQAERLSAGRQRRDARGWPRAGSVRPEPNPPLARSDGRGLRSDCKLAALRAVTLAPETNAAVHAAQLALEQEASKAEAVNDPTAPTLRALSLAMGACHKLYVDGSMTIGSLIEIRQTTCRTEELDGQ